MIAFGATLAIYALSFWGVEYWRGRKGPWQVTFEKAPPDIVVVTIDQERLGVRGFNIRFTDANPATPDLPITIRYDSPSAAEATPLGKIVFLDTTVLPGTVTFDLFGHEIELLPRTLIIDKVEHAWSPARIIDLPAREPRER